MRQPFEGIFGNNCELRVLEFLLPLSGIDFNVTEFSEEAGVSRPTATRVIKKFICCKILKKTRKRQGNDYYTLNDDSPYLSLLSNLNNLLIEDILGEVEMTKIHNYCKVHSTTRGRMEKSIEVEKPLKTDPIWFLHDRGDLVPSLTPPIVCPGGITDANCRGYQ